MESQGIAGRRANALKSGREIVVRAGQECKAPAEVVFDLLADLRSHLVWAGEQQGKKTRLVSMEAPAGPAAVGTEFRTAGLDPMGGFTDVSVVTEATRPHVFEFVTEAHLQTKKGKGVDWTNVHRYELIPTGEGCRIDYAFRVTRISELPGMLGVLDVPVLSAIALKASASTVRRGLRNLARLAEQRAGR